MHLTALAQLNGEFAHVLTAADLLAKLGYPVTRLNS